MQNNPSSKMNSFAKFSLGLAGCGAAIVTAYAACVFDATTGVGFVEKGDVQTAFGWNNAKLQDNADSVFFTYVRTGSYTIECEWQTETGGKFSKIIPHSVTHTISADVNSAISVTTKSNRNNVVTGFNLGGFVNTSSAGSIPEVGANAPCPGEQGTGAVGTVISVAATGTSGGLYVNHGDASVLLLQ